MEKDVYSFWEWVQRRMDELGILSIRELERKANVSNGSIGSRKNELKFPTVEMAEALCDALRVSWGELWEQAGFARLEPNQLRGLDAEIYQAMQDTGDDFKGAVLKTVRVWLILYEELRK